MAVSADVYKYTTEMNIIIENKSYKIKPENIKNVLVNYDYIENNMPTIFVSVSLDKNLIDDMMMKNDNSVINFTIYKYISNSDVSGLKSVYIQEQFAYFMQEELNTNKEQDYNDQTKDRQDIYKEVKIGLMKLDLINKNRSILKGIIKSTSMTDIIYKATQQFNLLLEPLDNNPVINQIIIPPTVNTVSSFLSFLNNFKVFYNSGYRFFMDFKTTYLLSLKGIPIPRKGEKIMTVLFNIKKTSKAVEVVEGMITDNKQKMYQIDIAEGEIHVPELKNDMKKSFSNISTISTSGSVKNTKLNIGSSTYLKPKNETIRIPNSNDGKIQNIKTKLEMDSKPVYIQKMHVDTSVLTPNKEYVINNSEVNKGERGRYLLCSKKEMYIREDDGFRMAVNLLLKKV